MSDTPDLTPSVVVTGVSLTDKVTGRPIRSTMTREEASELWATLVREQAWVDRVKPARRPRPALIRHPTSVHTDPDTWVTTVTFDLSGGGCSDPDCDDCRTEWGRS